MNDLTVKEELAVKEVKQNELSVNAQGVISRQAQEVQAAMVIAKRFPRDQYLAISNINKACQRKRLAEQATYSYVRGGTKVSGPSIRLAEVLAQSWGNLDFGMVELEQRMGIKYNESVMMAYCWDLETNTRQVRMFSVPHVRDTKGGPRPLTEQRDIYEMAANMGARRLRACILGIIPGDIVDDALTDCRKTLVSDGVPLNERIKTMVKKFSDYQISTLMLEKYMGYKIESFSVEDVVKLLSVYNSIKDGISKREDYFDIAFTPAIGEDTPLEMDLKGEKK